MVVAQLAAHAEFVGRALGFDPYETRHLGGVKSLNCDYTPNSD